MIVFDLKSETPILKSHDWLSIGSDGIFGYIKDFSYLPANIANFYAYGPHLVVFDGTDMIVYDKGSTRLIRFNASGYNYITVAGGLALEITNDGLILLQTDTALNCYNKSLSLIWSITRNGVGFGWYDSVGGLYYSPQATSLDAINPNTGQIIKSASLSYAGYYALRVGDYIVAHRQGNVNKVFNLDLVLIKDNINPQDYSNLASYPKIAKGDYWIGSKPLMFYTDALLVKYKMNTDGTFYYDSTISMDRQLGPKQPFSIYDWELIGTKHPNYFAYVKVHSSVYNQQIYGYAPREDFWLEYKIHTSEKIVDIFSPLDVLVSTDRNYWEKAPITKQYTGDIYFRVLYNPEYFFKPVIDKIYFITARCSIETVSSFIRKFRRVSI